MTDQEPVIAQPAEAPLPQTGPDGLSSSNKDRPGSVTTISILAIVLAALGLLTVLMGVVGLLMSGLMVTGGPMPVNSNGNNEIQRISQDMQTAAMAVNLRYQRLIIAGLVGACISSSALLYGGVRVLLRGASAYGTLRKAFMIALVIDVPRLIPTLLPQREMLSVYQDSFAEMGEVIGESQAETIGSITTIGMYVGLFIAIGWVLVKVGFYIAGSVILGRHQRAANTA